MTTSIVIFVGYWGANEPGSSVFGGVVFHQHLRRKPLACSISSERQGRVRWFF